jgi:hypothetical protein
MRVFFAKTTVLLTVAVALLNYGCSSDSAGDASNLGDLVDLSAPGETEYAWTHAAAGHDSGLVVFRSDGERQRWDWTADSSLPREGTFNVYRGTAPPTIAFGCTWTAPFEDRARVRVECPDSGVLASRERDLYTAIFDKSGHTELADRTILGRNTRCMSAGVIQEACVDDAGYILYIRFQSGDALEATIALDLFESFTSEQSPDDLLPGEDQTHPSEDFDFPLVLGLHPP